MTSKDTAPILLINIKRSSWKTHEMYFKFYNWNFIDKQVSFLCKYEQFQQESIINEIVLLNEWILQFNVEIV